MLAAREQDPRQLAEEYREVQDVVLCIDGLQPEKGHETLYVVRELRRRRVWFAEALISSAQGEVRRLLICARQWAEQLGKPVRLWISDKQEAFVSGIAAEFPGVPHRYCSNHFLRDAAQPLLEADSHLKVQMRRHVRGLRSIEREVVQGGQQPPEAQDPGPQESAADQPGLVPQPAAQATRPQAVVLDYCTAVRGILNDDQGGPVEPPGLRMSESLRQVRSSLQQNLEAKKGATHTSTAHNSPAASTAGSPKSTRGRRNCGPMLKRSGR